jgi:hypothetical protein
VTKLSVDNFVRFRDAAWGLCIDLNTNILELC